MGDLQARLVNKRLANKVHAALNESEHMAARIAKLARDADQLLEEMSTPTQMSLPERMLRAMTVRHRLAMIQADANAIMGEVASVFDQRKQVKNGNGAAEGD